MLCWAHSSRALNVVRNGSSLSFTSTEAPRDSFTMAGEAPGIRASFGILKRSPLPLSTYAPGSLIDSHVTSVSASLRTACADWVMVSSFGLGIGFLLCEVPPLAWRSRDSERAHFLFRQKSSDSDKLRELFPRLPDLPPQP